jgi:hypothetical protein
LLQASFGVPATMAAFFKRSVPKTDRPLEIFLPRKKSFPECHFPVDPLPSI